MTDPDRTPSDRVDVCIVGAGVAGGVVAHRLAREGHETVLLEAGPRFAFGSRTERMERSIRPEHVRPEVWDMGGDRDDYSTSGDVDYRLNRKRVKGVGGSTLAWKGVTPRLHRKDFEMESRYGLASDWPIDYADLRPYYAIAERELGVAGRRDNPFGPPREEDYPLPAFPPSRLDARYAEACDELGIAIHSESQARNSEPYDGRSQCVGFGTCEPVCPSGAKYTGDTHVRKAESEGARTIDRVPVQRLEHDRDGRRVTAAVYATPDGTEYRQEARHFVLACGAVEIPRLLLLSRSERYPDGLANSSGLVGRYFMEHPHVATNGVLAEPTNQTPTGFTTSASEQFYDYDSPPPGSFRLHFANRGPSPARLALAGGDTGGTEADLLDPVLGDQWGDALVDRHGERLRSYAGVRIYSMVEQLPRKRNAVGLDPDATDDHGNPVPDVRLHIGPHERRTMRRALAVHSRILDEMGAEATTDWLTPDRPGFGAHHMGTTRMGDDPAESVVDPRLRTHDLSNLHVSSSSVFTTGGAVNPTLTIVALAVRLADTLSGEL